MFFFTGGPFWMKNVPYPLEIAFLDKTGSVLQVDRMAPCMPGTIPSESYDCPGAVYALELPIELAKAAGVRQTDRVVFKELTI